MSVYKQSGEDLFFCVVLSVDVCEGVLVFVLFECFLEHVVADCKELNKAC